MPINLNDLIYLIYTAADRYQSIHIKWTRIIYKWGLQEVYERKAASLHPGSFVYSSLENFPEEQVNHYEVWWHKNKQIRFDQHSYRSYRRYVIDEHRRWTFVRNFSNKPIQLVTNDPTVQHDQFKIIVGNPQSLPEVFMEINPLEPAFMLAVYRMQAIEEIEYINRPAIRVEATYERNREIFWLEDHIWTRADKYNLIVDAERGIVLRYVAIIDDKEAVIEDVEYVAYDEPLGDELFQIPKNADEMQ